MFNGLSYIQPYTIGKKFKRFKTILVFGSKLKY